MRSFFIDTQDISGAVATIRGQEARHISSVLRLAPGGLLRLFDGGGMVYEARIEKIHRDRVEALILASSRPEPANGRSLHLGLAVLKGKKTDLVVQKATELGVAGLHPFISKYCLAPGGAEGREAKRSERWQKIAREACKQCNRPTPPACHQTLDFVELLRKSGGGFDLRLIFWEEDKARPLKEFFTRNPAPRSVMILIGPEGGFSREEIDRAVAAGFQPATLGRSILRAETAAIAAAAIIQYLLGNLEGG